MEKIRKLSALPIPQRLRGWQSNTQFERWVKRKVYLRQQSHTIKQQKQSVNSPFKFLSVECDRNTNTCVVGCVITSLVLGQLDLYF